MLRGSPTRPGHVSQRRPRQPLRRQRLRGRPARDLAGWGVASAAKGKGHGGQLGAASGRGRRWLGAVPAGRPAMAASPRAARSGGREREGCWEGERGDEGRSGARLWRSRSATIGRARGSGARPWWGASSAWLPRALPLGNFPEHLAGDDVATLEPSFGHLRGIFGSRSLKQSGCSPKGLQFLLRMHGH